MIAGFLLGSFIIVVGWLAGPLQDVPWPLWSLIPAAVLTVVSLADRDGWNIRRAMAYVAVQQRARWTRGRFPSSVSAAVAWLDDPANTDANSLERISALLMIGNMSAGRALLDEYVPTTDVQVAAVARLRAHHPFAGDGSHRHGTDPGRKPGSRR